MSGIYGFSYGNTTLVSTEDALAGMCYWNRLYGHAAHEEHLWERSGIGCHTEHLSEKYPYGGPVFKTDTYFAVVDALLFNRDELMEILQINSDERISDEELILSIIRKYGFHGLAGVNGDFAGAIYDISHHKWYLFRDHMGIRPLHFYSNGDLFAFSTDIRGIASLPGTDLSMDEMMLYRDMIGCKSLYLQETNFKHIRCARPAAVTIVDMNSKHPRLTEKTYWKPRSKKIRFRTNVEYCNHLRSIITDSVHRRCDAISGLLGAELSGGLDSSVIDILVNRYGREAVYFSWSSDPGELPIVHPEDERNIIFSICEQENISCHFTTKDDVRNHFTNRGILPPPYVNTRPMSVGSMWIRNQGAKVVFTGHMGDEGVSHRGHRFELFYHKEFVSYFKLYLKDARAANRPFYKMLQWGLVDAYQYWKQLRKRRKPFSYYPELLDRSFCSEMKRNFRAMPYTFQYDPYRFIMMGGSRGRLDNAAYHGSLNGVRYIFPYADYRVVDFALSIPRRLYIGHNINRLIFRDAFRDIVPQNLFEVTQKYTVSTKDLPRNPNYNEHFYDNVRHIVSALDPEQWKGILNLDAIAALAPANADDHDEEGRIAFQLSYLIECIRIQEIQKKAKKWREFDEHDKTV